jgi:hypothetical protein
MDEAEWKAILNRVDQLNTMGTSAPRGEREIDTLDVLADGERWINKK